MVPVTPVPDSVAEAPTLAAGRPSGIRTEVLVTGTGPAPAIAGDAGGATDHHAADRAALEGEAMAHLARRRVGAAAVSSGLVYRDVLVPVTALGARLIAGHLAGTTHFVAGHTVAVAGGRTNLAGVVGSGAVWQKVGTPQRRDTRCR